MRALMIAFLASIVTSLIGAELEAWLPVWSSRLVAWQAARLPPPIRERMREEWEESLATLPGPLSRLRFAFDLFRAVPVITHDVLYPGVSQPSLGALATIRTAEVTIAACMLLTVTP